MMRAGWHGAMSNGWLQAVKSGERFMLIEPSCAAAFRDEYPDLVPSEQRDDARRVAQAVITVEEWLAEVADAGLLAAAQFDDTPGQIVLHGHCYQRALVGHGRGSPDFGPDPELRR